MCDNTLKKDQFFATNIDDERLVDWVIENIKMDDFEIRCEKDGNGMICDNEEWGDDNCAGRDKETGIYTLGIYKIYAEEDYQWEEWMFEITDEEIWIFVCPVCKWWTIEDTH